MSCSKLDRLYRSIIISKYFIKGWGTPENLKKLLEFRKILSCREECLQLVGEDYPVVITKDKCHGDARIIEGYFPSPFDFYLPTLLPKESRDAYFQVILPRFWLNDGYKPVCIHLAGTGDHYFWRRRHLVAKPLLREGGIGSVLLENPFYGSRKPVYQARSVLHNVSDIFVMGGSLILEGLVLLRWCKKQGFGPLGVSGLSMGGHMASLVATNWPYPLILVPCLSWSTASGAFTEGVMSRAINWDLLQFQYRENDAFKNEIEKIIQIRNSDAFKAGKELVKKFPESMSNLKDNEEPTSYDLQPLTHVTLKKDPQSENLVRKIYSNFLHTSKEYTLSQRLTQLMRTRFPQNTSRTQIIKSINKKWLQFHDSPQEKQEALNFMRGIMDEFTHISNFSKPVDTSLIISVCARDDGYVPCQGVNGLADIWAGAEVRFIDAGHISAFVLHQKEFRQVIIEAFQRYRLKYLNGESNSVIKDP